MVNKKCFAAVASGQRAENRRHVLFWNIARPKHIGKNRIEEAHFLLDAGVKLSIKLDRPNQENARAGDDDGIVWKENGRIH